VPARQAGECIHAYMHTLARHSGEGCTQDYINLLLSPLRLPLDSPFSESTPVLTLLLLSLFTLLYDASLS
jgi:hypothetical protein